MPTIATAFSVFTKFWNLPLPELAVAMRNAGVDGVELPVRPEYPVTPENLATALPEASRILADEGMRIFSVAPPLGPITEKLIEACAKAGVPLLRVMVKIGPEGYLKTETQTCAHFESRIPALENFGITLGVQNHSDEFVANAAGVRRIVERFDRCHVSAIYDVGHCGLDGELPALAVNLLQSHLAMVNLKNMVWERVEHDEGNFARWKRPVVAGREGLMPWPDVAAALREYQWSGPVTLCAEYRDLANKDALLADDIAFARELFGSA